MTALSARNAWAVGNDLSNGAIQTVILHWNGSSWHRTPSPSPSSSQNRLFGVAATSASNAWAVGYDLQGSKYQTLIVHWNGSSWQRVPSPNPAGTAHQNRLSDVTAVYHQHAHTLEPASRRNGQIAWHSPADYLLFGGMAEMAMPCSSVQFCAFSVLRATGLARRLLATRYLLGVTGNFQDGGLSAATG